MVLGFVLAGMFLGLVSAGLMLAFGAGFGAAFLAYIGFGSLGTGAFVAMAMLKHAEPPRKTDELPAASLGARSQ